MSGALSQTQYLGFHIGTEQYAVPILLVREIIAAGVITKVPGAPRAVRGVINLRGNVVPVIDLSLKFGAGERGITSRSCIVIVDVAFGEETIVMGVLADAVSQVIDLAPEEIEPPPSFGTLLPLELIVGMGRMDRKFVIILDVDRMISAGDAATVTDFDATSEPVREEAHA